MPKSPMSDVVIPERAVHDVYLDLCTSFKDKTALVSRPSECSLISLIIKLLTIHRSTLFRYLSLRL